MQGRSRQSSAACPRGCAFSIALDSPGKGGRNAVGGAELPTVRGARALDEQGNLLVDREVDTMQKMAPVAAHYWQMLALVADRLLLVIAATLLISKPIANSNRRSRTWAR